MVEIVVPITKIENLILMQEVKTVVTETGQDRFNDAPPDPALKCTRELAMF